jgi:hypothetical protein
MRERVCEARRIVVKLGSNLFFNDGGAIALGRIFSFIELKRVFQAAFDKFRTHYISHWKPILRDQHAPEFLEQVCLANVNFVTTCESISPLAVRMMESARPEILFAE